MTNEKQIQENESISDEALEGKSSQLPQYLAAILATLGAFSAGTCLSWTSPALPLLEKPGAIPFVTHEQGSWIGSLITLGAFAGAIPAGMITNFLGRKRTLQLLALPILASWLLIAFSTCVYTFYFARFLAGIAVGAYSVAIPMYVAELAEAKIRGTLGTLFQLQITLGILFEYLVGMTEDFALIALLPLTIPIFFLLSFSFVPESPVFLYSKGRIDEARTSLQWFRGPFYDIEDEISKIKDQIEEAQDNKANISDLVKSKSASRAMIIALGLMVFQQLSGINAVIFYTGNIFENAGSTLPTFVPAIIVGAVMVMATYVSTILIDRAGRRILLLVSCSVMAACLASFAIYFHCQESLGMNISFAVPLLSIAIYITVFSLGFGPIPWMMLGELFPAKMKGVASSIAASFNWLLAFTVTKLFQNMLDIFGSSFTFGGFTVVCIIGTIFVFVLVPETKGKDMEEIQIMLGGAQEECQINDVVVDVKK